MTQAAIVAQCAKGTALMLKGSAHRRQVTQQIVEAAVGGAAVDFAAMVSVW